MSLPMDTHCIECNFRRNLALAHSLGDEAQATAFMKDLLRATADLPDGEPSPVLGPTVTKLLEKHYGLRDRFRKEREDSNRFVLERLDAIREKVNAAEDPLYAGLQFAVLGNYLDFSALQGKVSFRELDDMLDQALALELDTRVFRDFCRELERGKTLLYLTDNAGEIGFDRIFAETIHSRYPHVSITFCVRGRITANDATRADAEAVGIPFPVIDNGNDVAGTVLEMMSPESRRALETADVILSKGMGNCETLFGCGLNIYYAFLVKCEKFRAIFQKPLMTPLFVRDPQHRGSEKDTR